MSYYTSVEQLRADLDAGVIKQDWLEGTIRNNQFLEETVSKLEERRRDAVNAAGHALDELEAHLAALRKKRFEIRKEG
jgi:hypothetical protein